MTIMPKLFWSIIFGMISLPSFATVADKVVVGKNVSSNMDVLGLITSLLIVLGLIVVSAFVLKKFNFAQSNVQGMKVITSLSLGTKERLYVVEVNDQQLLLGVTSQQITLIEKLEQPIKANSAINAEIPASIVNLLKKNK